MLATAGGRSVFMQEGALANRDATDATQGVLRLAGGELDRAYRLAGLIIGDGHEAQDATQDALLRAWRSAASLRDQAGFQASFDKYVVNVCRDRLRARGKVRLLAMDESGCRSASPRDPFREVLDRDEVFRAMAALDDD